MATKRKKSQAGLKSPRPVRQQHSQQAESAAANDELFLFKVSFGNVPGGPVGCDIGVVAVNPEAALARARALIASVQVPVSIADSTVWPDSSTVPLKALYAEYVRVYFGAPDTLTLKHVTMVSDLGDYLNTDLGELIRRRRVRGD